MKSADQALALDDSQVDIWLARDPQLRDPAMLADFSALLGADERARVARMQFEAGRHQQLVTRALVRIVLSRYAPEVPAAAWVFGRGEHGRPHIVEPSGSALHFNLAHTEGLVAVAVARVPELGIDVERADMRVNLAVARRYFSAAEVAALEELPTEEQPRRFRRLWTLKEAYLKATGAGITAGLGSMTFHFRAQEPQLESAADPLAAHWVFREPQVDTQFMMALAFLDRARAGAPSLRLWEFSGQEQRAEAEQRREADAVRESREDHAG